MAGGRVVLLRLHASRAGFVPKLEGNAGLGNGDSEGFDKRTNREMAYVIKSMRRHVVDARRIS